jgi:nucleoside-diphosphate-sugar epimerase
LSSLRGEPDGSGFLGRRWRRNKKRVPVFLPSRGGHLDHRTQFVHLDDMARLIAHVVRRNETGRELTVINVAGRGDPLSLRRRLEIAGTPIKFLPLESLCRPAQGWLFRLGISDVPPRALPYLSGSAVLDTARLRSFLGEHYRAIIQHTCEEALQESFAGTPTGKAGQLAAVNS